MIRKMKLTDLDKVMDTWLFSNIRLVVSARLADWQQVRSMLPEADKYMCMRRMTIWGDLNDGNYIPGIFVDEARSCTGIGRELL